MRALARLLLASALLLVLAGCSGTSAGSGFELAEWAITGPSELATADGELVVVNSGSLPHTLVVTNSAGEVVAATDLIQPGETSLLDLDLPAGRYSFTCRIVAQNAEGEIVDHFEAGMNKMVSVDE